MVKKNSCIFISGTGTNLNALIKSSRRYNFPININLIVSNKKNAPGLIFAKRYSIPFKIINTKKLLYCRRLSSKVFSKINLFMSLVSTDWVDKNNDKLKIALY